MFPTSKTTGVIRDNSIRPVVSVSLSVEHLATVPRVELTTTTHGPTTFLSEKRNGSSKTIDGKVSELGDKAAHTPVTAKKPGSNVAHSGRRYTKKNVWNQKEWK
jgi:hypothetical protein